MGQIPDKEWRLPYKNAMIDYFMMMINYLYSLTIFMLEKNI